MKARKAKPTRPRISGGPKKKKKRETFASENRRKARLKKADAQTRKLALDHIRGPVNVIDAPIPKRTPGKIGAGGALTVAFVLNAQELRDLRVLAVARGYPAPTSWSLQKERAAAKWMLPKFVADQIEAGRPKVSEGGS